MSASGPSTSARAVNEGHTEPVLVAVHHTTVPRSALMTIADRTLPARASH